MCRLYPGEAGRAARCLAARGVHPGGLDVVPSMSPRFARLSFHVLVMLSCLAGDVMAQAQAQAGGDSAGSRFFDEYGNARSTRKSRRSGGGVLSTTELTTPTSVGGGLGLRPRGVLPKGTEITDPFTYTTRPGAKPISRLDLLLASPNPVPAWRQQVFRSYGGFEPRRAMVQGEEGASAIMRRYALIGAASINAPVIRANWQSGFTSRVRLQLERSTFDAETEPLLPEAPPTELEVAPTIVSLEERLREDNLAVAERLRNEGWDAFHEGNYRRAARTFDAAAEVNSDDELRIGELFSYYALGAMSTASAVLAEVDRSSPNPFDQDLSIPNRFRRVDDVARARIQARLDASSLQSSAETAALAIFVLWFLEDRAEALSAANRLGKLPDAGAYASWPEKMRAVMNSESSGAPRG